MAAVRAKSDERERELTATREDVVYLVPKDFISAVETDGGDGEEEAA